MGQFPIVEPDSGHTKIRLVREGLEAIQRIKNPIAVVGVRDRNIDQFMGLPNFILKPLLPFYIWCIRLTKFETLWQQWATIVLPLAYHR
ncbi:hypothetical protein B296_00009569 [Ensete ventricosum]|uniref:Uncharacterized protein n=1 Tax=Ensete ventricosum TaxID=4639 RepID=A0A427BAL1_ENSVE|nr:hypothetical protein B296_00009569 [Ensete ventricosum]